VRLVFFLEQFVLALSAVCIALPITWAASRIVALALKRSDVVFPWPDVLLLSGSIIAFVLIFAWMVGGRGVKEGLAQAVRAET
jgi:ABC-type antimicrobial peptide transport system permease subunit